MRGLIQMIIVVILSTSIAPLAIAGKGRKNPQIVRYMNAVGKNAAKKHKKVIRNYTHTAPAQGARSTTMYAVKKYHVITGYHLKNRNQKRPKFLLPPRPRATLPHAVPGQ
jgi:hypothetical protein